MLFPIFNDFFNLAIAQVDGALGMLGDLMIVGDHYDSPSIFVQLMEQIHYFFAGSRVQISSGLVRQYENRIVYQRPGNRHPLLLSTGEFVRLMLGAIS